MAPAGERVLCVRAWGRGGRCWGGVFARACGDFNGGIDWGADWLWGGAAARGRARGERGARGAQRDGAAAAAGAGGRVAIASGSACIEDFSRGAGRNYDFVGARGAFARVAVRALAIWVIAAAFAGSAGGDGAPRFVMLFAMRAGAAILACAGAPRVAWGVCIRNGDAISVLARLERGVVRPRLRWAARGVVRAG